jgi:hypothetical protein
VRRPYCRAVAVRYSPTKDVDCDLIYGRNLIGERANWITLALTFRIGDK